MSVSSRIAELAAAVRDKLNEMTPRLLPQGGQTGQILIKDGSSDFGVTWTNPPEGSQQGGWKPVRAVATGAQQNISLPEPDLTLDDVMVFVEGVYQHSGYGVLGGVLTTTQPMGFEIVVVAYGRRARATYEWTTSTALSSWRITHSLDRFPRVLLVDSSGGQITGQVTYLDRNNVEVVFDSPVSGTAYFD